MKLVKSKKWNAFLILLVSFVAIAAAITWLAEAIKLFINALTPIGFGIIIGIIVIIMPLIKWAKKWRMI